MADLKGTKTEENLKAALAGESQARVKYEFYASQAKKDGYVEIKEIFQESSDNEKEHAKIWFKLLNGGKVPDTLTNLADAAAGEHEEWTEMYKEFAETAREEGFDDIADLFDAAGATEKAHEDRYNALTAKIKADKVFKKDEEIAWKCNNCGYIHYGTDAPEVCPLCDHPQAHFRKQDTSYI
ncbi:MAG: rubrerythrin family protein [Methanobrevibacter thaueri]|jgi:rubrerythrin|uniref:rubrerythrin n=1 Tax=Methanobrevibacter thaueri TaxID=190975 RepID=UPI0026E92053|nr:rubrerythrin family protein [Methanobrevibacter thaueri]MBE6495927.1 rubrerythrin family protein [Methanobrevibacter thaueri]